MGADAFPSSAPAQNGWSRSQSANLAFGAEMAWSSRPVLSPKPPAAYGGQKSLSSRTHWV